MEFTRPKTEAEKTSGSTVDTILFSTEEAQAWRTPPFQRPLKINAKVQALALTIKQDKGVLPGIVTLGKVAKDPALYIVDGQHRIQAFVLSGVDVGCADVRMLSCQTMSELGVEFVNLNSHLVRMTPDDILRGIESSTPALQKIIKECPFIGYDNVRRSSNGSAVQTQSADGSEAATCRGVSPITRRDRLPSG